MNSQKKEKARGVKMIGVDSNRKLQERIMKTGRQERKTETMGAEWKKACN